MPSLEEMRARKGQHTNIVRDTATVTLVDGHHLAAQWQRLENERIDLLTQLAERGEEADATRKSSQRSPSVRVEEIAAEKLALNARMVEFQNEVAIQSREIGDWLRWTTRHPAARDDEGNIDPTDLRLTGGVCSAVDLLDDLGTYVVEWDGEPLTDGDWDTLAGQIIPGDLQELLTHVVNLHGKRYGRAPKSPSPSSSTGDDATD